jgi:hypothetical protein
MQYHHPEYGVVTPLAWFSSHVNIQTVQGIRPVQPCDLTPIEPAKVALPEKPVLELLTPTVSVAADVSEVLDKQAEPETEPETATEDKQPDSNLVNLNTSSTNQLSRALPFIGSKRAKLIVANRPEGTGYRGWEQFRELNPSLLDDETAWAKLAELVTV